MSSTVERKKRSVSSRGRSTVSSTDLEFGRFLDYRKVSGARDKCRRVPQRLPRPQPSDRSSCSVSPIAAIREHYSLSHASHGRGSASMSHLSELSLKYSHSDDFKDGFKKSHSAKKSKKRAIAKKKSSSALRLPATDSRGIGLAPRSHGPAVERTRGRVQQSHSAKSSSKSRSRIAMKLAPKSQGKMTMTTSMSPKRKSKGRRKKMGATSHSATSSPCATAPSALIGKGIKGIKCKSKNSDRIDFRQLYPSALSGWYYIGESRHKQGPTDIRDVRRKYVAKELRESDLLWHASLGKDWAAMSSIPGLVSALRLAPSPPSGSPPRPPLMSATIPKLTIPSSVSSVTHFADDRCLEEEEEEEKEGSGQSPHSQRHIVGILKKQHLSPLSALKDACKAERRQKRSSGTPKTVSRERLRRMTDTRYRSQSQTQCETVDRSTLHIDVSLEAMQSPSVERSTALTAMEYLRSVTSQDGDCEMSAELMPVSSMSSASKKSDDNCLLQLEQTRSKSTSRSHSSSLRSSSKEGVCRKRRGAGKRQSFDSRPSRHLHEGGGGDGLVLEDSMLTYVARVSDSMLSSASRSLPVSAVTSLRIPQQSSSSSSSSSALYYSSPSGRTLGSAPTLAVSPLSAWTNTGFPLHWFAARRAVVAEGLVCAWCGCVPRNAVPLPCNAHIGCQLCAAHCPQCAQSADTDTDARQQPAAHREAKVEDLRRRIAALSVGCPIVACQWKGSLQQYLATHRQSHASLRLSTGTTPVTLTPRLLPLPSPTSSTQQRSWSAAHAEHSSDHSSAARSTHKCSFHRYGCQFRGSSSEMAVHRSADVAAHLDLQCLWTDALTNTCPFVYVLWRASAVQSTETSALRGEVGGVSATHSSARRAPKRSSLLENSGLMSVCGIYRREHGLLHERVCFRKRRIQLRFHREGKWLFVERDTGVVVCESAKAGSKDPCKAQWNERLRLFAFGDLFLFRTTQSMLCASKLTVSGRVAVNSGMNGVYEKQQSLHCGRSWYKKLRPLDTDYLSDADLAAASHRPHEWVIRYHSKSEQWMFDKRGLRHDDTCNALGTCDVMSPKQIVYWQVHDGRRFHIDTALTLT